MPDADEFFETTKYGFIWGAAEVTRVASIPRTNGRYLILGINTDATRVDIYISPKGRVRVFKRKRMRSTRHGQVLKWSKMVELKEEAQS